MMSRTMAEAQLPKRVDAGKLVDSNQQFTAYIDSANLERLNSAVVRCDEPIHCQMVFERDTDRKRVLTGSFHTNVVMCCQRCLGDVTIPLQGEYKLGFVLNDEQAKALPRQLEPVELDEDGKLDLWSTIEDEVLLSLPNFPMHPESECQIMQPEPEPEYTDSYVNRVNPFDVLAKLKQK